MEDSSPFAKVIKKVKVHYVHVAILTVIVSIIHRQICRMASIILFQSSGCVWCSCIWPPLTSIACHRSTVPCGHTPWSVRWGIVSVRPLTAAILE